MACRCSDIINCTNDINKLANALTYIQKIEMKDTEIDTNLVSLSNKSDSNFIIDDLESLKAAIKVANDNTKTLVAATILKITTEKARLENEELPKLKAEDKAEHGEDTNG